MATEPFFSIIIPALNEERYLPLLLKDLANQTIDDFEVIVVDGQSKDKTVEKAKDLAKELPSLTILTSKIRNVSVQRNMGGEKARGQYLLFNDADNRLPKHFVSALKKQALLHHPDILSVYMDQKNSNFYQYIAIFFINIYIALQRRSSSPYVIEALLGFKRDIFLSLKGFNPNLLISEGTDILRRAKQQKYSFFVFKKPRYLFSLRRLEKEGFAKMVFNIAKIEISRFFGKKLSKKETQKIYPMSGGNYYNHQKK